MGSGYALVGCWVILFMDIELAIPRSRKYIHSFRHFSQDNSPSDSNNQLSLKDSKTFTRNPNRRYNNSTKLESSNKLSNNHSPLEIPESFLSTNLRIRQKVRERSYHAIRLERSTEKSREQNYPIMKPIIPPKEIYEKIAREEMTTKHFSLFHTNDPEEEDGLQELFYQQVKFLQKCKELARNSK